VREQPILSAVGDDWPIGIVGLIAGRLTDRHYRPALVISRRKGEIVGSGRSIEGFDITAGLRQCDQYLSRYGGHSQACGFTVKDEASLQPFLDQMASLAKSQLDIATLVPVISIDAKLKLEEITWELLAELEKFIPFGSKNQKPKFLATDISVRDVQTVGADGKHLRLTVSHLTAEPRKLIGYNVRFTGPVRAMKTGEVGCFDAAASGDPIVARIPFGKCESDGWRPATITEIYEGDELP